MDHLEALGRIQAAVRPRTYLEIGVAKGRSLRLAAAADLRVGVDPAPRVPEELSRGCVIAEMTSDAFFDGPRARDVLWGRRIDLGLIDGLHLFERALKDFINLESFAAPHALILVHDCLPLDSLSAARRRSTDFWTGDVWKLVPLLREARPDLLVSVVDAAPSGLCLISRLDPQNVSLAAAYRDLVVRWLPVGFEAWEALRPGVEPLTLDLDDALALHGFAPDGAER